MIGRMLALDDIGQPLFTLAMGLLGGPSLSIPAAKPGIYPRMRRILQARNLGGALIATVLLGGLVMVGLYLLLWPGRVGGGRAMR